MHADSYLTTLNFIVIVLLFIFCHDVTTFECGLFVCFVQLKDNPSIVIAKSDATANDYPPAYEVRG